MLLSGRPVYDPNPLRPNPNPEKPVSGSCRVRGLGRTLTPLPGLPDIANMLYVEGLKVNLLSISQICDQDFMELFSKGKCLVLDEPGKKLISGVRTLNNCYGLILDADIVCNSIRLLNEDL